VKKKVYFVIILPLIMMIAAVSCSSTKKTNIAPEPPKSGTLLPVESAPETAVEADNGEEIPSIEDTVEEPVLAQEEPPAHVVEPEPPVEVIEPEPPAVAVTPKPEPAPQAVEPPPEKPVPQPEPPKVTAPPPATARPAAPPSAPPAPVEEEKPPVIAQEPQPRDGPELPYPTPGISGREDAAPSPIVFSRIVRATVGQLVEVPFRGTGWVYLGEIGAQRGIVYDSRRLDAEGQSFIFRTERAGEYALKFYRQDFIRDYIINDYVQVIVGAPSETAGSGWFNPPMDRSRVVAEPRWPSALTEAQTIREDSRPLQPDAPAAKSAESSAANAPATQPAAGSPAQPPSQPQPSSPPVTQPVTPAVTQPATPAATPTAPTTTQPPAAVPDAPKTAAPELPVYIDPAEYLEKAKQEFAAGRIASAISFLDRFCEHYPSGTDETWWLYGQLYEANSPSRNILTALNCYRRLVQEYPQSGRFDDARKRIAYLQRYYIHIN